MHTKIIKETAIFKRELAKLIAILCCIAVVSFQFALPAYCQDWVYSVYFQKTDLDSTTMLKRALDINDERIEASNVFLTDFYVRSFENRMARSVTTSSSAKVMFSTRHRHLEIVIVSVKREDTEPNLFNYYLTQATASILRQLNEAARYFNYTSVTLCNVNWPAKKHNEAEDLQRYFNSYLTYDDALLRGVYFNRANLQHVYEKEKNDYVFCLQNAASSFADYVLVLQDDALLEEHFFVSLHQAIGRIEDCSVGRDCPSGTVRNYLLKLYYPEKWQGYSNEPHCLLELTGIALCGGSIAVLVTTCLQRFLTFRFRTFYNQFRTFLLLLIFTFGALYFTAVAYTVGRPYVLLLRRLSPYFVRVVSSHDCCVPAVLYPQRVAKQLVNFLESVTCDVDFPLDLAIDRYAMTFNAFKYTIEPNLVKHIGLFSSLKLFGKHAAEYIF